MADTEFELDESKRWFVELGRIDPMTREAFAMGDRVIICRSCKIVHKDYTWKDNGGCCSPGCNCKTSAKRFLAPPSSATPASPTPAPRMVVRGNRTPPENHGRIQIRARTGADGIRIESAPPPVPSPIAPRRSRSRTVTPPADAGQNRRIVLGNAAPPEHRTPIIIRSRHDDD